MSGILVASLLLRAMLGGEPERPPSPASSAAGEEAGAELVEVEVANVLSGSEWSSVVLLREKGGSVVLPIVVGRSEGAAIELRLRGAPSEPHHAADLLDGVVAALGGKVTRVEIRARRAALFQGKITLEQGTRRVELTGRPSDSVALALGQHAPIYATRRILSEEGLRPADVERLRRPSRGASAPLRL